MRRLYLRLFNEILCEALRWHHRLRLVQTPRFKVSGGGGELLEAVFSTGFQGSSMGRAVPVQASRSQEFHCWRRLLHQISATPGQSCLADSLTPLVVNYCLRKWL